MFVLTIFLLCSIIQHVPGEEEDDTKQLPEKPSKRPRSTRKKVSYNPFLLVPCQKFPSSSAYPFSVIFQSDALVVIDVHCHLSTTEVIGLLGGTYSVTERVLKVNQLNLYYKFYQYDKFFG